MFYQKLKYGLVLLLVSTVFLRGEVLFEWNFDDPEGTMLADAVNTGTYSGSWDASFNDSMTNGQGQFVIRRTPGEPSNAFLEIEVPEGESLPEKLWVILEIDRWNFAGRTANETLRLGLAHVTHELRPSVLAQIRFGRVGDNQVAVIGEAFGDGAEDAPELPLFLAENQEPVVFALSIDTSNNEFELYYRQGDGDFLFLGDGETSPDREPRFLRFGLAGHFAASGEYLVVDRIAITDQSPLD